MRSVTRSNKNGHGSDDCGSVAFSARSRAFLDGAPIHGRSSRGGGAALTLRGNGSGCVRHAGGMRRGSSGDVEGRPNAGNGSSSYAGRRIDVHHLLGPLLSHVKSHNCVASRLRVTAKTDKRFSDQRVWHDLYADWPCLMSPAGRLRPLTNASTSGPNCSSLRAPIPGIATSAASSVGSVSAIAIKVLSVNTT